MEKTQKMLTKPDYELLMKAIFGPAIKNTSGVMGSNNTTTTIKIKKKVGDIYAGQLIYFPKQSFVSRVITVSESMFTIWPPCSSMPTNGDKFEAGMSTTLVEK